MEFKFDPNQEFQNRAIESVTDLLEGQPRIQVELSLALGAGLAAIPNRLDLDENTLLANLRSVQEQTGLTPDEVLQCIDETIETAGGSKQARFPNFSVEMETGTGKTYVYLRTALELYQRYGMRKFIVVVPSVAIREGVLKTMRITERHLLELYGNAPYRYYVYASENLSQVRQFALSDGVEMMVMTIDSFNKASNVINQSTDRLQGETPIHLVQAARPILILDEPQNMESELRVKALSALDPLFALRYSATHRNPYNVVYRLTPFEAYRQSLVKRIEVASVVREDDANQPFIRLEEISTKKNIITARVALHKLMKSGVGKEQVARVKHGDSLEEKTGRPEYAGFVVDEISPAGRYVRFTNNVELNVGEAKGADREAIFEAQIRYTVEEHLRRQARLRPYRIKVLSLFFIDRVDNYAQEDGIIRRLFVKEFNELKQAYPEWKEVSQPSPSVSLTSQQEGEFVQYCYKSRLPIHITGNTEKQATNIIEVNSTPVPIGDAPFVLFLMLVVELFKNRKGTVPKSTLTKGGYIKADGEFQAIARLRQAFNTALGGLDPTKFIEAFEPRTLRLSTHPAFVTYDKNRLLRHDNEKVRRVARRLP